MKIQKEFAPLKIIIETPEDKSFWLNVLYYAQRDRRDSAMGVTSDKDFVHQCQKLMDELGK